LVIARPMPKVTTETYGFLFLGVSRVAFIEHPDQFAPMKASPKMVGKTETQQRSRIQTEVDQMYGMSSSTFLRCRFGSLKCVSKRFGQFHSILSVLHK
jgi:hypothetical protein